MSLQSHDKGIKKATKKFPSSVAKQSSLNERNEAITKTFKCSFVDTSK
jgi:hypothetical protein